jgi:hypothetical protein
MDLANPTLLFIFSSHSFLDSLTLTGVCGTQRTKQAKYFGTQFDMLLSIQVFIFYMLANIYSLARAQKLMKIHIHYCFLV